MVTESAKLARTTRIWSIVVLTLACSLASLYIPTTALAQANFLSLDVRVGFDGYCHFGDGWSWCPLRIVVSNEGADIKGEIRVSTIDPRSDVYTIPAILPGHSRKAFYAYIPADNSSARLSVKLYAGEKEVLSTQVTVAAWLDQNDLLYGVLSSRPSALNFLSSIAPGGGQAVVAHLDPAALPPNPLGWESLDALILDDVDTAALDEERRQALQTWVSQGGHLIVGGGAGAYRTAAGIAELLPVALEGIQAVESLGALGELTAMAVQPGPYAVAAASIREGKIVIRQDDLILWARRPYGTGQVDFLAFEAALNPFTQWDGLQRLWSSIIGAGVTQAPVALSDTYTAHEASAAIPDLSVPSVGQIALFLLIYTALVGPLNYLLLRKLNRRELAWFTIPALTLGFTVFTYVTGLQLRGSQALVHQLVAIYVPKGMDTGRASNLAVLFSPRRTAYEITAANALIRQLPPRIDEMPPSLRIYQSQEGSRVRRLRVDIGGIRPLVAEGYVKVPEVKADLKIITSEVGFKLEGTFLNGAVSLNDAVLLAGNSGQRLGKLSAGDTAHISIQYDQYPGPIGLPERILGTVPYWKDKDLYRRYQFLQALFPPGSELGNRVYLLGWADLSPLSVEVVARPHQVMSEVLYIYELPVEELRVGKDTSIPPSLFQRRVDSKAGDVTINDRGLGLTGSSQIVLSFSIWPELVVQQVGSLVLHLQSKGGTLPTVSLWNKDTSTWEVMPVRWGTNVIPEGEAYFLYPGVIRVKLETGAGQYVTIENITVAIEGRR